MFGSEVVHAAPDGSVEMREAGGPTLTLHADLVIGADGVHSRVRECGNFHARAQHTGIRYIRGIVGEGLAQRAEAWTSAGLFGSFAVEGGTYFYASCGTRECAAAIEARDLAALRTAWAGAYAPAGWIL